MSLNSTHLYWLLAAVNTSNKSNPDLTGVLRNFAYLIGLDVHLLLIENHSYEANRQHSITQRADINLLFLVGYFVIISLARKMIDVRDV